MEEEWADEVSCPEKDSVLLAETSTSPGATPLPPATTTRLEIRAEEEGSIWKHRVVSDSQRSRVGGRTSSGEHLSVLYIIHVH